MQKKRSASQMHNEFAFKHGGNGCVLHGEPMMGKIWHHSKKRGTVFYPAMLPALLS